MLSVTITNLKRNLRYWENRVKETQEVIQVTRHGDRVGYFVSINDAESLQITTSEQYTKDAFRANLGGIHRKLGSERTVPDAVFVCDRYLGEKFRVAALVKLSFAEQLGVGDAAVRQPN